MWKGKPIMITLHSLVEKFVSDLCQLPLNAFNPSVKADPVDPITKWARRQSVLEERAAHVRATHVECAECGRAQLHDFDVRTIGWRSTKKGWLCPFEGPGAKASPKKARLARRSPEDIAKALASVLAL